MGKLSQWCRQYHDAVGLLRVIAIFGGIWSLYLAAAYGSWWGLACLIRDLYTLVTWRL